MVRLLRFVRVELVHVANRKLCSDSKQISQVTTRAYKSPSSSYRHSSQNFVPAIQLANLRAVFTAMAESSHRRSDIVSRLAVSAAMKGPVGCRVMESKGAGVAFSFVLAIMASIRSAATRCWWKDQIRLQLRLVRRLETSCCAPGHRSTEVRKTVCPSQPRALRAAQRCLGRLLSLQLT